MVWKYYRYNLKNYRIKLKYMVKLNLDLEFHTKRFIIINNNISQGKACRISRV